jgi:hypothetical protein
MKKSETYGLRTADIFLFYALIFQIFFWVIGLNTVVNHANHSWLASFVAFSSIVSVAYMIYWLIFWQRLD